VNQVLALRQFVWVVGTVGAFDSDLRGRPVLRQARLLVQPGQFGPKGGDVVGRCRFRESHIDGFGELEIGSSVDGLDTT